MTFTDDSLNAWKHTLSGNGQTVEMEFDELRALLARLEAAEACLPFLGTYDHDSPKAFEAVERWEKEAGK